MSVVARTAFRVWKRLVFGGHLHRLGYEDSLVSSTEISWCITCEGPEVQRRQNDDDDNENESEGTSTVTNTMTTTAVGKTTITDSTTTTDFVTSTVTKTIFQTSTKSGYPLP